MSLMVAAGARVRACCSDSLLGGTEMAPIEKLGDGRSTGLGWPHLTMIHNNQPNDGVGSGGGMREETRPGETCERERLPVV
jgi:hypothetical protein